VTSLRLAAVSDAIYPYHRGGKELRYHEILERLPSRGVFVDLYTMRWWEGDAPAGRVRRHAISALHPLYVGDRRSIRQSVLFALATLRLLRVPRPDVVEADHVPYLQLFPLRLVCWLRGVPLVVTWHEVWGTAYWRSYLGPLGGSIAGIVERLAARLPDRIVAASPETAARLRNLGVPSDRLRVILGGVRSAEIRATPAAGGAPDVLSIGRLLRHKRHDLVVDAFARLAADDADLRLGIVGSGPEREALERRVTALGLDGLVTFFGSLPGDSEVWALLRGARVAAFPSEREGFGLAVAESLAAGTPTIVADHPDNAARHLVSDGLNGSLVTPGDAAALAAAMRRWLSAPHDRDEAARRFVESHRELSWDEAARRYVQLLEDVAA